MSGEINTLSTVTIGEVYLLSDDKYIYLDYEVKDNSNQENIYYFHFIQRAYITDDTEVIGEIEEGKDVNIEYSSIDYDENEAYLKKITIIE